MSNQSVLNVYDKIFQCFMDNRSLDLFEKTCLDRVIVRLSSKVDILDCGCGMEESVAKYFMDKDVVVTGVDGCATLIEFVEYSFLSHGMLELSLCIIFDFIIIWHGLFHLNVDDAIWMFRVSESYLRHSGLLMFTTGPKSGEVWSDNAGENLYHVLLAPDEYKFLLKKYGFNLIDYPINDRNCNDHCLVCQIGLGVILWWVFYHI